MKRLIPILLASSWLAVAADTSVRWRELGPAIAGKKVSLSLTDGEGVTGNAVSVDADSLILETSKGRRSIPRASVHRISVPRHPTHKWRIIGSALGAGIGIAIAAPVLTETHNEGSGRYDAAAVALVSGLAALGYLVGWSTDKKSDIFLLLPD